MLGASTVDLRSRMSCAVFVSDSAAVECIEVHRDPTVPFLVSATMKATSFLSAVLLLVTACDRGVAPGGRHTVVDSAGIRITSSTVPVWGDSAWWRVSPAPELEIGAADAGPPEYLFSNAHSAMRLSDGRIAVGDMGSAELRYYDAQGRFLMRRGREGQGPGEWDQLYQMRRGGGDSIQIIAPVNTHSIFSPAGEYIRRFSLDPVTNRPNIWALGRLSSGAMLAFSLAAAGDRVVVSRESARGEEGTLGRDTTTRPTGFYREQYMHFLYTAEGRVIDSIGILPGRGAYGGVGQGALLTRGYYALQGDSLFFGPGDAPEIRVYELWVADGATNGLAVGTPESSRPRAGMTLRRIVRRVSSDSGLVTPEIMEAYKSQERATMTRRFRNAAPGFNVERNIAMIRFPPRLPAHGRIIADPTGALWMQDYVLPGAEDSATRWTVFDADGRWLGRMELPARLQVSDIGSDYVLGIWRNEDDVQFIRRYRLEREGAR
jgi:hypothetical protein